MQPTTKKHAFITGGGKGIGYAIAQTLLTGDYRVTIAGRNEEVLRMAAGQLSAMVPVTDEAAASMVAYVIMDVANAASVRDAIAVATARFGSVNILVNNAGQASSAPFLKTDPQQWQDMLNVNLMGTVHCTREVLPSMLVNGWGRIINVASTAGRVGYPYVSAYCAAKHAVVGLTRSLALEVANKGVTVNAVCPGYTETDIVKDAVTNIMDKTGRSEEQARSALAAGNPMQRLVQPDEVANTVAWLCQMQASAMTGQAIAVAGGEVMQ
ncbi:SDR family NAD(P)-dependent oxidoreductase [Undibacterium sp. RuRC25W]|uniref:SDR family NAD(P)-dependent oxidoreductase n=1 Tax=Undibacterium sp. RuRC25W TaxID=3413047 RepID=UPI003BF28C92